MRFLGAIGVLLVVVSVATAGPTVALPGRADADCFLITNPLFAEPGDETGLPSEPRMSGKHRFAGLASYYSTRFEGRRTANGEIYRNRRFSAAHLTLPLGTWIEVTSRATGRTLRMRVNDRGPYAKKFVLDLSQAAARWLGVDTAHDRHVDVRVIGPPGEEPASEEPSAPAGGEDRVAEIATPQAP